MMNLCFELPFPRQQINIRCTLWTSLISSIPIGNLIPIRPLCVLLLITDRCMSSTAVTKSALLSIRNQSRRWIFNRRVVGKYRLVECATNFWGRQSNSRYTNGTELFLLLMYVRKTYFLNVNTTLLQALYLPLAGCQKSSNGFWIELKRKYVEERSSSNNNRC